MQSRLFHLSMAFCAALAVVVAASSVRSGAPEGEPLSAEADLRYQIEMALDDVSGRYYEPFDLRLKAFLWDSRSGFDVSLVPDHRALDAVVCLLVERHGRANFREYTEGEPFRAWCDQLLRGV
jgi:hypothetical protein